MIFEFYIGGYGGTNFELHYTRGTLEILEYEYHREQGLEPVKIPIKEDKDWTTVLEYLDSRKWKGYYNNEFTCDGTQWEIKYLNRKVIITAGGSNEYPSGFFKFLKLLNVVTGKVGIEVR